MEIAGAKIVGNEWRVSLFLKRDYNSDLKNQLETFNEEAESLKMVNKRRWKEIEEDKDFKWMIESFREKEEIAKKVSEKTGFKVVYYIPPPGGGNRFYFYTSFDSKGMGEEEKMRMIERAIDAVEEAYGLWLTW